MCNTTMLDRLLADFQTESSGLEHGAVNAELDAKPVISRAARVFGNPQDFKNWLTTSHSDLGTLTPLDLLAMPHKTWLVVDSLGKMMSGYKALVPG